MAAETSQIRSFVERIEVVEAQKRDMAEDIRSTYAEAKDAGLSVRALREVIKRRRESAEERAAFETVLETYMNALGMLSDTPLGKAAISRIGLARNGDGASTAP